MGHGGRRSHRVAPHPQRDRAGFTLPEVLVAMVVGALLAGALASAFVVSMRSTDQAVDRVDGTQDVRWTARYFARDVQSSTAVSAERAPACGPDAAVVVSFDDPTGATVDWVLEPLAGADGPDADDPGAADADADDPGGDATGRLVRRVCRDGALSSSHVVADAVLGSPTLACDPGCDEARSVRLDLVGPGGFAWSLDGTRRIG